MQGFSIIPSAEKQSDFHQPLMDEMRQGTHRTERTKKRDSQRDVGHLAYGGKRQAALEVSLRQGTQRAVKDGDCGEHGERFEEPQMPGEGDAIDVVDHAYDTEGAGLDYRYGMEQSAYWRRRHHCCRQPAVQRHECRLDAETGDQKSENPAQCRE